MWPTTSLRSSLRRGLKGSDNETTSSRQRQRGCTSTSVTLLTHERTRNMLEPDQWDSVLGSVTGTIYRGTERISSNALLNVLEVGPRSRRPAEGGETYFSTPVRRPDFPELCGSMSF